MLWDDNDKSFHTIFQTAEVFCFELFILWERVYLPCTDDSLSGFLLGLFKSYIFSKA